MAIGDVIGSPPGPWWFDMDGSGTKSRKFTTKGAAENAGKMFAAAMTIEGPAKQAVIDAENAAKAAEVPDEGPSLATQAVFAKWQAGQGR